MRIGAFGPRCVVLAERHVVARLAIDLDAAEKDKPADPRAPRRLGEAQRAGAIDAHGEGGIGLRIVDMDMGGEMDDGVNLAQGR